MVGQDAVDGCVPEHGEVKAVVVDACADGFPGLVGVFGIGVLEGEFTLALETGVNNICERFHAQKYRSGGVTICDILVFEKIEKSLDRGRARMYIVVNRRADSFLRTQPEITTIPATVGIGLAARTCIRGGVHQPSC